MGVELINGCVVFPHQVNWKDRPKHGRQWSTAITPGITGSEERLSGSTGYNRSLEYTVTTFGLTEQQRFNARVLAARKSGRACVPYFGRGQELTAGAGANLLEGRTYPPIGVFNVPVVESKWYAWIPGPNENQLQNGAQTIFAGQAFFALNTGVTVIGSPNIPVTAQLRLMETEAATTDGLWTWKAGDWAFFLRPFQSAEQEEGFENRDVLIDCGTASSPVPWNPDTGTGGAPFSGVPGVDVSQVKGWDPAPSEVYQNARNISTLAPAQPLAYSTLFHQWQVSGLVPGQRYFYIKGDADNSLSSINADGNVTVLLVSGSFVAGTTFAIINGSPTTDPGSVHLGGTIRYQVNHLLRGVACNVRLHFAEIEAGFDGTTAHRKFSVFVTGDRQIVTDNFEPYHAAGDIFNKAAVLDFTVYPDAAGRVTIELLPEAPYFAAGINAIEIYQRSWEVVQLIAGSGAGVMVWDGALKGSYQSGWLVFPAFFGRLAMESGTALTGRLGDYTLAVQEPLGDGELGVNACPAETCVPDPPLTGGTRLPVWNGPSLTCLNRATVQPKFENDLGNLVRIGVTLDANGNGMDPGVLEVWAGQVWDKWEALKASDGIEVDAEQLYYQDTGNDAQAGSNANLVFVYQNWQLGQHWRWEIWVEYCPKV